MYTLFTLIRFTETETALPHDLQDVHGVYRTVDI